MSDPYIRVRGHRRYAVREHVVIAEKALGKPLPIGAQVHHLDENKKNNNPNNLVICPDQAYHTLLHRRQAAFDACGHYDWVLCRYCHKHDSPVNLTITSAVNKPNGSKVKLSYHKECNNKYHRDRRATISKRKAA